MWFPCIKETLKEGQFQRLVLMNNPLYKINFFRNESKSSLHWFVSSWKSLSRKSKRYNHKQYWRITTIYLLLHDRLALSCIVWVLACKGVIGSNKSDGKSLLCNKILVNIPPPPPPDNYKEGKIPFLNKIV